MNPVRRSTLLSCHLRDRKILRPCCSSAIRYTNYWSEFPEDVKAEILSKLSEKDLIKLKFVCKEWNFLISTICIPRLCPPNPATPLWGFLSFENPPPPLQDGEDDFDADPNPNADEYLRLEFSPTQPYCAEFMGESVRGDPTMRDHILSLVPSIERDPSQIIDCCNGLILLEANSECYFLGNPVRSSHAQRCHSSLAFDPSISLGFRIVRYTRTAVDATPSSSLSLEMFSSECGGGWSSHVPLLEPQSLYGFEWIKRPVYFKGALYYMSMAMYLVCIEGLSTKVKAWAVELPDKDKITVEQGKKGVHGCIRYSLGCFYYSNRDVLGNVLVWMLVGKGKSSGWVLKHCISIDRDVVPDCNLQVMNKCKNWDSFRPGAFHPNEDVLMMGCSVMLVSYHLKTKNVDLIHLPWRHRRETIMCDHNQIFPYARCLLSLNTITSE